MRFGEVIFEPADKADTALFRCSLCGVLHVVAEKDKFGIHTIPNTITTSRNKKGEHYFHCVECAKDIAWDTELQK
jgi:hypothetical protein